MAKTLLVRTLAATLRLDFKRVQFTPDLMPGDVTGSLVYDARTAEFEFRAGPVFTNLLLADEINRTPPKTQSALLESMAEGQVTVAGETYPLEPPFLVLATQNPAEHEGAYPLPDSQLDRFLLRVSVGYPSGEAEARMLDSDGSDEALASLRPVLSAADVVTMAAAVRRVHVADPLRGYLVDLAAASRGHARLALGMSPRATLSLQRVAQARALVSGRDYVVPDDIKALAPPTLAHRLQLASDAAISGTSRTRVVHELLERVPVPNARTPG